MKYLLLFLLSISTAHASLPELFGASAGSIAIGNQAQENSAANNYYAAALLGYSKSTQFSFDLVYVKTDFKEIDNVVTENENTTVDNFKRGSFDVNPTPTTLAAINFSTPLFAAEGPKFNLSIFVPVEHVLEADTGNPYSPQYAMYGNRINRPIINLTLAQSFNDWSFGAGVHTGLQTSGEGHFVTRTTSGTVSQGNLAYNAKPSVAALLSVAKKHENKMTYFNFQQEMKSRFKSNVTSETEIANNAAFQFDLDTASLLFYDPMTLRLGHQIHWEDSSIFASLEFQQWDSYESPTLKIKKNSGTVNSSKDYENLKLHNIFIPKIGYAKKLNEKWKVKMGYFYRPTPIDTDNLKNAGNTIDVDKHVVSLGAAHLFKLYEKDISFDFAYQAHFLKSQKIKKTAGLEDGTPDDGAGNPEQKIGSPGYEVGGMIHVLTAGLSWMY